MIDLKWSLKKMVVVSILSFIIICVIMINYFIYINYGLNPKTVQIIILSFSTFMTVVIIILYYFQSLDFMRIEKLPMLVIKKIDPNDWTFEIINASKYPVKVEFAGFIPDKHYNEKINKKPPQYVRFRHIFGSKGIILIPTQKIRIPDKYEAKIDVPGILKIRASNLYYSDLVLEYEYDIRSGRINRVSD